MDFEEFRQRLFLQICDKKDLDVNYSHLKEGSFLQKKYYKDSRRFRL